MVFNMIKAILYDLDGVLVDACEWHYVAMNKALIHEGFAPISRTEHEMVFNALPTMNKLDLLVRQGKVPESAKQKIFNLKQAFTKEAILENAKPDQVKSDLHSYTMCLGIKSACVTNSITETATIMLEKTGQLHYMETLITNQMVKNPKPHGEGYIRAMVLLGSLPEETIIVEDSDKGVKAALSTGSHIIKVSGSEEVNIHKIITKLKELKSI